MGVAKHPPAIHKAGRFHGFILEPFRFEHDYEYRELMEKMIKRFPNILYTQKADTIAAESGI